MDVLQRIAPAVIGAAVGSGIGFIYSLLRSNAFTDAGTIEMIHGAVVGGVAAALIFLRRRT